MSPCPGNTKIQTTVSKMETVAVPSAYAKDSSPACGYGFVLLRSLCDDGDNNPSPSHSLP